MEQLSFLVPTDMFKAGDLVAITKLGEADVEPGEGSLMFPIELGACLLIARGDDRIFRSSQVQAVAVETAMTAATRCLSRKRNHGPTRSGVAQPRAA